MSCSITLGPGLSPQPSVRTRPDRPTAFPRGSHRASDQGGQLGLGEDGGVDLAARLGESVVLEADQAVGQNEGQAATVSSQATQRITLTLDPRRRGVEGRPVIAGPEQAGER